MIEQIVVISLCVFAIHITMQKDHIFEFVSKWGDKNLPGKISKPIYDCVVCMSPWYGTPIYFLLHYLDIELFSDIRAQQIVFVILGAMGLNTVLVKLFPLGKEEAEKILTKVFGSPPQ